MPRIDEEPDEKTDSENNTINTIDDTTESTTSGNTDEPVTNTNTIDNENTNTMIVDNVSENTVDEQWINPETMANLIDIAVDILKQTIDNEKQTMTSLVGVAVDILTKTIEARKGDKGYGYGFKGFTLPALEYTLPKASVRLKDIVITTKHVNYYDSNGSPITPPESDESDEQSPESNVKPISRIVPVYDGMNNVKITAYTIEDYENGVNGEKNEKIITELNLAEIKLTDLQNPEKKTEIITNIIENLKKDHDVDGDTEKSIEEYLGKLGEAINTLDGKVSVLKNGINNYKNK